MVVGLEEKSRKLNKTEPQWELFYVLNDRELLQLLYNTTIAMERQYLFTIYFLYIYERIIND